MTLHGRRQGRYHNRHKGDYVTELTSTPRLKLGWGGSSVSFRHEHGAGGDLVGVWHESGAGGA